MNSPLFNDERLPAHFWEKVAVNADTGCWDWTASKRRRGYGRFGPLGGQRAAHRVAYEALVGPIQDGLQLDHLCRVPGCVNPAHLEPVTQVENMRRSGIWGFTPMTHCKNGHEFTPENTYWNPADEARVCRTCQRAAYKRHYDRQKDRH